MKLSAAVASSVVIFHFLLSAQVAFAQENYLPGYIVTLSGDTIQGSIDYRNWEYNPDNIRFRPVNGKEILTYGPLDIQAFSVHDEHYIGAIALVDAANFNLSKLPASSEPILQTDTIFLQAIILGPKSLYHLKRRKGEEHFYIGQPTGFELLVYKKYFKTSGGRAGVAENRRYLGQLAVYLQDCPSIQAQLERVKYDKKSLKKLLSYYYACTQSETSFQKTSEKISVNIGVLAGPSISSISFESSNNVNTYLNVDYPPSVNVAGGLFFDAILPRNQGKWSFCNELFFTSYQFSSRSDNYTDEDRYTINYTEINYAYVKLNSLVRFSYPVGAIRIYANAGMSNGFAINEHNYRRRESKVFSTVRSEELKAIEETRRYEQGLVLGLGARYRRYSLEARHQRANGMSEYVTLATPTRRYYLLLGYAF